MTLFYAVLVNYLSPRHVRTKITSSANHSKTLLNYHRYDNSNVTARHNEIIYDDYFRYQVRNEPYILYGYFL